MISKLVAFVAFMASGAEASRHHNAALVNLNDFDGVILVKDPIRKPVYRNLDGGSKSFTALQG